jgi:DNA-binding response OmpR family regulator
MSTVLAEAPTTPPKGDSSAIRGLKVLCIDDDPNIVNSLSRHLLRERMVPMQALHGMQGYWMACTERPDVIVVDLVMPRGNGVHVIECLRHNTETREIPIVVLSGANDPQLWRQVKALNVDATLQKPTNFRELLRVLQSLA